jgi:putative transposase
MFSISTFSDLLKSLPRAQFEKVVERHDADKYCKSFSHWQQLIAMLYAQLSGMSSLRTIAVGFNSNVAHHHHLGMHPIRRSTLADANERRADTVFSVVAKSLMAQVSGTLRKEASDLMYLLDSTSVTLKGREFDRWTAENKTRRTQGIKLHVLIDAANKVPEWFDFSAANVNDVQLAPQIQLVKGGLYVFDKGYCDYNWWFKIDQQGARFVTRFKSNAAITVEEERPIDAEAQGIVLADRIVKFKSKHPGGKRVNQYAKSLRYIQITRPDKTPMSLATNDLTSPALEIAQRYKERWGIELFFKWIKQHLKIKKFFGRSENAVRIQILTALIAYLLVALFKQRSGFKGSLWECLALVSATLLNRFQTEFTAYRRRRELARHTALHQKQLF